MRKYIFFIIIGLLGSSTTIAGQWIGPVLITKVWTQTGVNWDRFGVQLDAEVIDPEGCGNSGWYKISDANKGYRTALSTLLTAYSAGKPVKLFLNGCDSGYPGITNIQM